MAKDFDSNWAQYTHPEVEEVIKDKVAELEDRIYQKPASGIPATDIADGVIPDTSNLATKTELAGKVDKNGTDSLMTAAEHTKLAGIAAGAQVNTINSISVNGTQQTPVGGNVDISVSGGGETIPFDAGGTAIIDSASSPNANTVLAAASARWVKEIDNNVKAILAALAGMAFTGDRLNWQTVAKRTYTLSFGTLTGLDSTAPVSYANGDAVADDDTITEGYLKLILKPASSSYAFTSVQVNGKSVTATPVDGASDGSVYIEITVNDDVELSATASAGKSVSFESGNHCSFNENSEQTSTSVANNTDLSVSIYANKHYTLPSSITVKVGTSTLSSSNYTYTRATGNKTATLFIDKQHITDGITIDCDAEIMNSVEVAFSGSNVLWSDNNGNPVTSPLTLYEDDMPFYLHADPGSGYAMSQAPSITGTATNSFVADGDGYKLQIVAADTASPANELSISAAASAAHNVNVVVKRITGLTEYAGDTTVSPDMTITDDATTGTSVSNAAPVQDGGQFSGTVNPGTGFGVFGVKVMMGSDDVTQYYNPVTRAISIASVTDDLTITVTVREAVNGMFQGASFHGRKGAGANAWINEKAGILVADEDFCAMADFVALPSGAKKVRWVYGGTVVSGNNITGDLPSWRRTMMFYKEGCIPFCFLTIYAAGETQRTANNPILDCTVNPSGNTKADIKYIRASFKTEFLSGAKIQYTTDDTNYSDLWLGSEHVSQSNEE